jgi:hypothetical protein
LHLPVRVRALKAAPDTAGHTLGVKGASPPSPRTAATQRTDKPKFEFLAEKITVNSCLFHKNVV